MPKPFIKWAGGKSWLARMFEQEFAAPSFTFYVEPFLGGGAVALSVAGSTPKLLSDVNPTLMECWALFKTVPNVLVDELKRVEKQFGNNVEGYTKARAELNGIILNPRPLWLRRAALFLYLNARSFNGLWRTNSTGFMNVPFGKREAPTTISHEEARELSIFLRNCDLRVGDYKEILRFVGPKAKRDKVFVFFDSPYDGPESFDGYTPDGFGGVDQQDLAAWFAYLVSCGCTVWATNRNTEYIRSLYSDFEHVEINEHHGIGATAERRGKRSCLLIKG